MSIKEQHVSGLPVRWFKIHKPCAYCGETLHTNKPEQEYHNSCARRRKAEQTRKRQLEKQQ